jgi:hypothetical protein
MRRDPGGSGRMPAVAIQALSRNDWGGDISGLEALPRSSAGGPVTSPCRICLRHIKVLEAAGDSRGWSGWSPRRW